MDDFMKMNDEEKKKFVDFLSDPEKMPNVGKVSMIVPILAAMAAGHIEKIKNIQNQLETFKKFSVISQDIPSLEMIETIKHLLDEL